jgi:hypothetical protein
LTPDPGNEIEKIVETMAATPRAASQQNTKKKRRFRFVRKIAGENKMGRGGEKLRKRSQNKKKGRRERGQL